MWTRGWNRSTGLYPCIPGMSYCVDPGMEYVHRPISLYPRHVILCGPGDGICPQAYIPVSLYPRHVVRADCVPNPLVHPLPCLANFCRSSFDGHNSLNFPKHPYPEKHDNMHGNKHTLTQTLKLKHGNKTVTNYSFIRMYFVQNIVRNLSKW